MSAEEEMLAALGICSFPTAGDKRKCEGLIGTTTYFLGPGNMQFPHHRSLIYLAGTGSVHPGFFFLKTYTELQGGEK